MFELEVWSYVVLAHLFIANLWKTWIKFVEPFEPNNSKSQHLDLLHINPFCFKFCHRPLWDEQKRWSIFYAVETHRNDCRKPNVGCCSNVGYNPIEMTVDNPIIYVFPNQKVIKIAWTVETPVAWTALQAIISLRSHAWDRTGRLLRSKRCRWPIMTGCFIVFLHVSMLGSVRTC